MKKRLVVGVSGASGAPLAIELLRQLQRHPEVEKHLVLTKGGAMTLRQETGMTVEEFSALADVVHDNANIGAAPASGSWKSMGMIVCPCSMKTVAGIVSGYSDNLLLRAADCMLKERRKLVLVARESPLHLGHLRAMAQVTEYGAIVAPPVPAFYLQPRDIAAIIDQIALRAIGLLDLSLEGLPVVE